MRLQINEVLDKLKTFTGTGSTAKKVEWLQRNQSPTLLMVLRQSFDPSIRYRIPEGLPKNYKKVDVPVGYSYSTIFKETRKLNYLWLTEDSPGGKKSNLRQFQFEALFLEMLESLHPEEAAIVVAMKDKTLHRLYPITRDVVKKAFPNLLPEEPAGK